MEDVDVFLSLGEESWELNEREGGALRDGLTVVICTYQRAASMERLIASFAGQGAAVDRFVVVDASRDAETEAVMKRHPGARKLGRSVGYFRVSGGLRGLTRQRNFGLRWVRTDLVGFFDDDVVLGERCLERMVAAHRMGGEAVAGVGAYIENGEHRPGWLWRVRHWLRIVPDLTPGRYHRSGMSVPWGFMRPTEGLVEGDWLSGCSMMWKTGMARELGFREAFAGYAQGEDLEFSLRARRRGKLVVAGSARLQHLHDASGRPDYYKIGYMAIRNRFELHRTGLDGRGWRDVVWFVYAWTVDTVMLARRFARPGYARATWQELRGRMKAAGELVFGG
jgi:GT2 family glycosyltransferase